MAKKKNNNVGCLVVIGILLFLIFPNFREVMLISGGIILAVWILAEIIESNKKKKGISISSRSKINAEKKLNIKDDIIDVNSEKLDLKINYSSQYNKTQLEPPYWGHTYVYSYDEIKYATPEQKRYYSYFKKKVSNGEFVA